MKMYVDLFKSRGLKTTCTVSYNGRMVMYHDKDISYYVSKILEEAKECREIFVDTRGLSGCLYDCLKKADNQNRVKELQILRENEKDNIDKIFEILNFDKNKMPNFQEVIREFTVRWKNFNEEEKGICTKILSEEFRNKLLKDIENDFNFENKTLEVDMTPDKMKDGVCATIKFKRDMNMKENIDVKSNKKLSKYWIYDEPHIVKNGVLVLNKIPLKDNYVYIYVKDNKQSKTIEEISVDRKEIIMPKEYKDYNNTVYCTYLVEDLADIQVIDGDI